MCLYFKYKYLYLNIDICIYMQISPFNGYKTKREAIQKKKSENPRDQFFPTGGPMAILKTVQKIEG